MASTEKQQPINSQTDTNLNSALSPRERLELMSNRHQLVQNQQSDLCVAYNEKKDADGNLSAELIFTDTDRKQFLSIPTAVNKEQFAKITENILALDETNYMLFELAKAYDLHTPIMFEGGTAIGKTFVVNAFAKLIYGENAIIPDFYCNGQTDVSELMGKYVPAGIKPEENAKIEKFLKSDAGAALKAELTSQGDGRYEHRELYVRAAAAIGINIDSSTFEFQLGVLPKAMTAEFDQSGNLAYKPDGKGVMLHIQELGMAAPSVVNALLKIRGERGEMAESIQIWEDGGRKLNAGPGFFTVFSTNPVGKGFQERFEIDKALARALHWVNLPDKLSDKSLRLATSKIFSFDKIPAGEQTVIDLSKHSELSSALGDVMSKFHKIYQEMLEKGETGRRQKVPATIDSLWKVAKLVQKIQIPNSDFSSIEMVRTLSEAVRGVYINCLEDKPNLFSNTSMQQAAKQTIGAALIDSFEQILHNSTTDLIKFRGSSVTRAEQINTLTREAIEEEDHTLKQEIEELEAAVEKKVTFKDLLSNLSELKGVVSKEEFDVLFEHSTASLPSDLRDQLRDKLNQ